MAAHRYWRLYITASNNTETDLTEFYLRTTVGGASVATGGTAYADSVYSSSYVAAYAFDGVDGTSWASQPTAMPHWLAYDFGAGNAKDIVEYGIKAIFSAGVNSYSPKDFQLQYSDNNVDWTSVDAQTGQIAWATGEVRNFTLASTTSNAANKLDVVCLGQIFADLDQSSGSNNTTLDVVYLAEPIATIGTAAVSTASTATTSQAQQASASASAITGAAAAVATRQAQGSAASTSVSIAVTASTSQAQHIVSMVPLDTTAGTSQGQHGAATAGVGSSAAASSSQAQGAQAAASVFTPWSLIRRNQVSLSFEYSAEDGFSDVMPASDVVSGNHILFAIQYSGTTTVTGVTDTAGNLYTATPAIALSDNSNRLQWFYALNVAGNAANVIRVGYSADMASSSRVLTALHVQSPGLAEFDLSVRNATNSNSTSISAGPFNTARAGMIVAAVISTQYDTEAVWTNGMTFVGPRDTYFYGTGTRVTGGAQSATSVGITGTTVSSRRTLSAMSLVDAAGESIATRQGQRAAGALGVSSVASVATAQAQHAAPNASVATGSAASSAQAQTASAQAQLILPATIASAQAQAAAAEANLAVDTDTASAQAQSLSGAAGVAIDAAVELAQAQGTSAQLESGADASATTFTAQRSAGLLASAYVADVTTLQDQRTDAVAGVDSPSQGATAQGQSAAAEAAVSTDASATTGQRQRVNGQIRGESVNTIEGGQRQRVAGVLGLASDAPTTTRQGQGAHLAVGVAVDVQVQAGQAQHIGDGNLLVVSVDAIVSTAQARQHVAGVLSEFQALPGTLSLDGKHLYAALSGPAQARPVMTAAIRVRPGLSGRVEQRPER